MVNDSQPQPPGRTHPVLVERLYVLWLGSSLLLLLLVVVVTLVSRGHLVRHAETLAQHDAELHKLRSELIATRAELAATRAALADLSQQVRSAAQARPPQDDRAVTRELRSHLPEASAPKEPAANADSEAMITALLDAALRTADGGASELADPTAAQAALEEALRNSTRDSWAAEVWGRLAVAARLLGRGDVADVFADRAAHAGAFPRDYYELSARHLLGSGAAAEAAVFARRLAADPEAKMIGLLLLADAELAMDDTAAAVSALDALVEPERLSLADRLHLGHQLGRLELWERLDALVAGLDELPAPARPMANYLRAILAIHHERYAEGLAILDDLAAGLADSAAAFPLPNSYDVQVWRGAALAKARQFQAAREALACAQEHPERPEAWYWLGYNELAASNEDEAIACLQQALAASARFAPAWEVLGTIALNHGDAAGARQNLQNAVRACPWRASSHLLLALAHARLAHRDEAAEALRAAFRLDATLLATAQQTPVITKMFSANQLEALAGPDVPTGESTD